MPPSHALASYMELHEALGLGLRAFLLEGRGGGEDGVVPLREARLLPQVVGPGLVPIVQLDDRN